MDPQLERVDREFCGKRGDFEWVCVLPPAHSGRCETNTSRSIWKTLEELKIVDPMSGFFYAKKHKDDYLNYGKKHKEN